MAKRSFKLAALLFLAVLTGVGSAHAQAQTLKIGYTDHQALLFNMPEYQDVQQTIQQEIQERQQALAQQQQEVQDLIEQFAQQQAMLSDSARTQRQQEIRQQRLEVQQAFREQQTALRQREQELMQPLLEELQGAIEEVAQAQNIDLVVSRQAILYVNGGDNVVDITPDVAQKLGIDLEGTAASTGN